MLIATGFDDDDNDNNRDEDYEDVPQLWSVMMRKRFRYEMYEWRLASEQTYTAEEVIAAVMQIIDKDEWDRDEDE